jgi:hypothetical protein
MQQLSLASHLLLAQRRGLALVFQPPQVVSQLKSTRLAKLRWLFSLPRIGGNI